MSAERKEATTVRSPDSAELESYLEEFSIMELEDRLELTDRCNGNCKCEVQIEARP